MVKSSELFETLCPLVVISLNIQLLGKLILPFFTMLKLVLLESNLGIYLIFALCPLLHLKSWIIKSEFSKRNQMQENNYKHFVLEMIGFINKTSKLVLCKMHPVVE